MGNINNVMLEGYLTRDPIVTQRGGLLFTIASNKSRRNKETNEWEDIPRFINASLSFPSEYQKQQLVKGAHVFTAGEIGSYTKERDGRNETVMVYEVRQVTVAPRSQRQETAGTQTPPPRAPQQPQPPQQPRQNFNFQQAAPRPPQRPQPQQQARPTRPVPQVPQEDEFSEFEEGYQWDS